MDYITTIGSVAAVLTTFSSLPQLFSIIKTKNVEGISITMFLVLLSGVALWTLYGFLIEDKVILFANLITLTLLSLNIFFVLRYRNKKIIVKV